jgi:RNA recognition motif-containing protein
MQARSPDPFSPPLAPALCRTQRTSVGGQWFGRGGCFVKKLFIGNIGFTTTSDELTTMCAEFGQVSRSKVATDRESGKSRGFGFVEMQDGGDAAIEALNNRAFKGRNLTVNEARPRPTGGGANGTKV